NFNIHLKPRPTLKGQIKNIRNPLVEFSKNRYTPALPLSCLSEPGGGAGERDNAKPGMEVALPNPVAHLKSLDPVRLSMDHLVDRKTDASVRQNSKHQKTYGVLSNNRAASVITMSRCRGPGGCPGERDNAKTRHGGRPCQTPVARLQSLDPVMLSTDHLVDRKTRSEEHTSDTQ